jgi:two-component system, OmpR family, response regulator BaeR
MTHILVVEDEISIADAIKKFIQREGFECTVLHHATNLVEKVNQLKPDLLVLDIMLPGGDGVAICRTLRQENLLPIILLTAKVSEAERLIGLEAGADDYICKPFSAPELMLRIKAVLRRTQTRLDEQVVPLILDENKLEVSLGKHRMGLTTVEFSLLKVLVENPHRIFSRDAIMDLIYPDYRVVSDRTVDSHVSKLRKKLKLLSDEHELVCAVYGAGYKYAPIEP